MVTNAVAGEVRILRRKIVSDGKALDQYRYFQAPDLPADGGSPALTPQLTARRARAKKIRLAEAPIDVCPTCNTQLPATKVCDNYCS